MGLGERVSQNWQDGKREKTSVSMSIKNKTNRQHQILANVYKKQTNKKTTLKHTVTLLPSVFCPNCQSWHSCSLGLLSSESLWSARRAVKKYGERYEKTWLFSRSQAKLLPRNQTCAICIAWLLFRSHILAVLSQEAVKTLLPSWLKRHALRSKTW